MTVPESCLNGYTAPDDGSASTKKDGSGIGMVHVEVTEGNDAVVDNKDSNMKIMVKIVRLTGDDKPLRRTKVAPPVDEVADEISRMAMFETFFFTRETLPKLSLPYGLIREYDGGNKGKAMTVELPTTDPDLWLKTVYDDCISFIKEVNAGTKKYEWYHDFIAFTNLQIAIYGKSDLIMHDEVALDLVLDYTNKHVRNLRSAVARNVLLFITCMLEVTATDVALFVAVSVKILPQLLMCSTSEKAVYREPAVENLVTISGSCYSIEFIDIGWIFMDHANHRNPKLSHSALECLRDFSYRFDDEAISKVDINDIVLHVGPCLASRNVTVREVSAKFMRRFIAKLPTESIDKWWLEVDQRSNIAKILKPYVTVPPSNEETSGVAEVQNNVDISSPES